MILLKVLNFAEQTCYIYIDINLLRKTEHLISKNKVGFLEEYLYYGVYVHVTVILFFNQRFHTIFIAKLKKNK